MQKIVIFIEPNRDASYTLDKIGNLFMNRFSIEEDEKIEILKIYQLETDFLRFSKPTFSDKELGKDLIKKYGDEHYIFTLLVR